jgi:transposase
VSESWVRRLRQRRRESGGIAARKAGRPPGRRLAAQREQLRALNANRPDATLAELPEALGASVSIWTIWRARRDLEISFKIKRSTPPSRTGQTSRPGGQNGESGKSGSTRGRWLSSTKRGRRPI